MASTPRPPERCLGIARFLDIAQRGGGGDGAASYVVSQVTGVQAFHPDGLDGRTFDELRAERPLPAPPVAGVHAEILNSLTVARAVHPDTHRLPLVPSSFPYLPSTPQELLRAYLEIVGVRPGDSYSAQVTEDDPRDLSVSRSRRTPSTNSPRLSATTRSTRSRHTATAGRRPGDTEPPTPAREWRIR